jgi:hypothetical protein
MRNTVDFKGYGARVIFNPVTERFEYQHVPHPFEAMKRLDQDDPAPTVRSIAHNRSDTPAEPETWDRRAA